MSVLVSQFICPPTPKNTLLCIRKNHGFCGSGIWMQWEGLVSVWCQSGKPEAGETSASGAGPWAGMGGRLGSAGTLGHSASQVAPPAWWPQRVAGPFMATQGYCVPRGICMVFMTHFKSHMASMLPCESIGQCSRQACLPARRQHCPGPQWEGLKHHGHVKAAAGPLNFLLLWSFDVLWPPMSHNKPRLCLKPRKEKTPNLILIPSPDCHPGGFYPVVISSFPWFLWSWRWSFQLTYVPGTQNRKYAC